MGLTAKLKDIESTASPIRRVDLTKAPVGIYKEAESRDAGSIYIVMKDNNGDNVILRVDSSQVAPLSNHRVKQMMELGYSFIRDSVKVTLEFNNNSN